MIPARNYDDVYGNPYLEVLYEIYNRIWELRDLTQDTNIDESTRMEQEQDLVSRGYSNPRSETSITNIELQPITFTIADTATNVRNINASSEDRWVHISTEYPARHVTPENVEINAWVQQIPVRIEVFLRQDNNVKEELTIRSNKIANDLWLALNPDYFTNLPFSDPFAGTTVQQLLEDVEYAEFRGTLESQSHRREALKSIVERYHKYTENSSQLRGFRINNAGIQSWGPVNDFRGTNEEILVFIFRYELVRYIGELQ